MTTTISLRNLARHGLLLLLTFAIAAPLPAMARSRYKPKPRNTPATTKPTTQPKVKITPELEQQVLEIMRRNPEVIYEVLKKYAEAEQARQEQKDREQQALAIRNIFKDPKTLIGDSPTMGATDRKIILVVFSDFQCPYCSEADKNLKQFMAKYKDQVTLVFKHFPLTQIHPQALPAAKAAWAAHQQGKFWEYHDGLFANQSQLGEAFYLKLAEQLKLDLERFKRDYNAADNKIVADFSLGRRMNVNGTPALVMNGETLTGVPTLADLEKVLAKVRQQPQ